MDSVKVYRPGPVALARQAKAGGRRADMEPDEVSPDTPVGPEGPGYDDAKGEDGEVTGGAAGLAVEVWDRGACRFNETDVKSVSQTTANKCEITCNNGDRVTIRGADLVTVIREPSGAGAPKGDSNQWKSGGAPGIQQPAGNLAQIVKAARKDFKKAQAQFPELPERAFVIQALEQKKLDVDDAQLDALLK